MNRPVSDTIETMASQPPSKRPKLRTAIGGGAGGSSSGAATVSVHAQKAAVTLSSEYMRGFCAAFLQDEELSYTLKKLVQTRPTPAGAPSPDSLTFEAKELPTLPLQFETAKEYALAFQPLMIEEAKAQLLTNLQQDDKVRRIGFELVSRSSDQREDDSCVSTKGEPAIHCKLRSTVRLPEQSRRDWRSAENDQVKRIPSDGRAVPCGLAKLQRGDVVIILHSHMAKQAAGHYETFSRFFAFGIVSRPARPFAPGRADDGGVEIDVAVTRASARQMEGLPLTMYFVEGCNLVTSWREWDGMNALLADRPAFSRAWTSPLVPYLLSGGQAGRPSGAASSSSSTPSMPSPAVKNDLAEVFEAPNVANVDPNMPLTLPGASQLYQQYLLHHYNASQMEAIAAASSAKSGFVLVQGPPGTGKTHTLLALLNSLHLSVSQQWYEHDLPDLNKADNVVRQNVRFDWLKDGSNPHLLIVAPSNAAIDNVLRLVVTKGFLDGQGNRYKPKCVRIGSSSWNNSRGQDEMFASLSLDAEVDALLNKRARADSVSVSQTDELTRRLSGREAELRDIHRRLVEAANEYATSRDPKVLDHYHQLAGMWAENKVIARDITLELEKRRLLFFTNNGSDAGLREDLRAFVLTQANLVFGTLAQCGSASMTEIAPSRVRFQVCVIDEAAQAVEPSSLVPLQLGVDRCVMVGDPSQLPATVISEKATRARYQQSLFERLQRCGHSVHLLDVQYRCRPELSSFCSRMFYGGRLKDGDKVKSAEYALPIYRFPSFGPLVFFDVAFGSQARSSASSSFSNEAEAAVCMDLYLSLRHPSVANDTISPATGKPCHIALISPYREQLSLLQNRFRPYTQRDSLLELNTVDGFQGREVDIVIFSCVRGPTTSSSPSGENGSEDGGIGFLNDARRLNVAETRARFSLLIVGNRDVLSKGSRMWRSLLDHVRSRGEIIPVTPGRMDYFRPRSPVHAG